MNQSYLTNSLPLVSVIIPAYNAENFLEETLLSVISQTYKNLEIFAIDDGSQDGTPQIVKKIMEKDVRVMLLQQSNQGVAAARNLGIKKAQGDYIAPLDADDIWYPKKIEKQVECFLENDSSIGLVYAWSVGIDEEGFINRRRCIVPTVEGNVFLPLLCSNLINTASTPLIRRTCLEKVGYYNCELKQKNAQGCEDWELYLRIAQYYQFRVVPEILVGYRKVVGSMSRNHIAMAKSMTLTLNKIQQKYPEIPKELFQWSAGNFYRYLAGQSQGSDHHQRTIFWLCKALNADVANYLDHKLYARMLISLLKLLAHPITSLVWSDHLAWEKFRKKFNFQKAITLDKIQIETDPFKRNQRNLYQIIKQKRWLKILKYSHINFQDFLAQKQNNYPNKSKTYLKN